VTLFGGPQISFLQKIPLIKSHYFCIYFTNLIFSLLQNDDSQNESESLLGSDGGDNDRSHLVRNDTIFVDSEHADSHDSTNGQGQRIPAQNLAIWKLNLLEVVVPITVVLIPTSISFFNDNVVLLASITGSFPGTKFF
jgi:hypothetical protein